MSQYIISTDLDGTLLNHTDYNSNGIKEYLHWLLKKDIPVIFNTSKTFAEVQKIQRHFDYYAPCIVENGGGIFTPSQSPWQIDADISVPGAACREDLVSFIRKAQEEQGFRLDPMSDWDTAKIIAHTGLSKQEAELAHQRHFSEPMLWLDTEVRLQEFQRCADKAGFNVVQGGRFCHLMGMHDKQTALTHFLTLFADKIGKKPHVIALGDSQNDKRMLEGSDTACVLKLPNKARMSIAHSHQIHPEYPAPMGWIESLDAIFLPKSA